jgi:nicotinamidase-related amidase
MGKIKREIIEGKPVLVVIDIQGGECGGDEASTMPFMSDYQDYMDRAPSLVAKARDCGVPIVFFQEAHRPDLIDFGRELDGAEGIHYWKVIQAQRSRKSLVCARTKLLHSQAALFLLFWHRV